MADIVRWNPFREMAAMQRAMDHAFDNFWSNDWPSRAGWSGFDTPALDIHENDQEYTVTTSLPGIKPDDINIRIHNGVLTIGGEYKQPELDEKNKAVVQERYYGSFSRSVTLPQSVDEDKVEASYDNGVLTLKLPKSPEAQPKTIQIKSGSVNGKKLPEKS